MATRRTQYPFNFNSETQPLSALYHTFIRFRIEGLFVELKKFQRALFLNLLELSTESFKILLYVIQSSDECIMLRLFAFTKVLRHLLAGSTNDFQAQILSKGL